MIDARCSSAEGDYVFTNEECPKRRVHILGTEWAVLYQTLEQNSKFSDCDGYCDPTSKRIYVRLFTDKEVSEEVFQYEDRGAAIRKVTRHEILHAFFYESGLWVNSGQYDNGWTMCEEMIDWVAIQFPKIANAYIECGCAG